MQHRHLLPNEIDLLLDGEVGFGVAPLRAHLADCAECRTRLEESQAIAALLDEVPHFAPSSRFSDAVMQRVQIVEPWHVAALETVQRAIPASPAMRALALGGAGAVAITISGSAVWLAFRVDLATWAFNLFVDRGREALVSGAGEAASQALGASTLPASSLAIGAIVLATTAIGAVAGFRRLATASRQSRS